MKTKYIIIVLLLMALPTASLAQIGGSIFDHVETDELNEHAVELAKAILAKPFADYNYDSMEANCMALIGDHVRGLLDSQMEIEKEHDCKKKKDLLAYQSLLLVTAGTKIFCLDEFNSDKKKYGMNIFLGGLVDGKDAEAIARALKNISEGAEKFGNPYLDNYDFLKVMPQIQKEYKKAVANGEEAEIDPIFKKIMNFSDKQLKEFYTKSIHKYQVDFVTYFLSPEFIAKRAMQIEAIRKSLPCD